MIEYDNNKIFGFLVDEDFANDLMELMWDSYFPADIKLVKDFDIWYFGIDTEDLDKLNHFMRLYHIDVDANPQVYLYFSNAKVFSSDCLEKMKINL